MVVGITKTTEKPLKDKPDKQDDGTVEKERGIDIIEIVKDDERQVEDMEDVEQSDIPTTQNEIKVSVAVVKDPVETGNSVKQSSHPISSPKEVIQSTVVQIQTVLSTTQEESSSTQYPNSTPSNPAVSTQEPSQITTTQDDSQQPPSESQLPSSKTHEIAPTIPFAQTPILPNPPSYLPQRHFPPRKATPPFQISPPKATPATILASAQIQVKETPLPAQRPAIPFSSSPTHISATAPSPVKEGLVEPMRRKHKRERHVGPVVPKFSRRERKIRWDLKMMLMEDRKRFQMSLGESEKVSDRQGQVDKEDVIMEEVVEARLEVEKTVEDTVMEEAIEERLEVEKTVEHTVEHTVMEEVIEESLEVEEPERVETERVEREEKIIITRVDVPQLKRSLSLDDTEDDSQTFVPAKSPWGQFAIHWRRFPPSK